MVSSVTSSQETIRNFIGKIKPYNLWVLTIEGFCNLHHRLLGSRSLYLLAQAQFLKMKDNTKRRKKDRRRKRRP